MPSAPSASTAAPRSGRCGRSIRLSAAERLPLFAAAADGRTAPNEEPVALPEMPLGEHVVSDYRSLSLSLKAHPVSFLRRELAARRIVETAGLPSCAAAARVSVAGLVLVRQRPGTASGVIFATLEDETGVANVIVWPKIFERLPRHRARRAAS